MLVLATTGSWCPVARVVIIHYASVDLTFKCNYCIESIPITGYICFDKFHAPCGLRKFMRILNSESPIMCLVITAVCGLRAKFEASYHAQQIPQGRLNRPVETKTMSQAQLVFTNRVPYWCNLQIISSCVRGPWNC